MKTAKPDGDVIRYIREARTSGLSDFQIAKNLSRAGWEKAIIRASFLFSGKKDKKLKVARIKTFTGKQKVSKSKFRPFIYATVFLILLASISWFSYSLLVVKAKTVFGFSLLRTAIHNSFKEGSFLSKAEFIYADPQSVKVRQGSATVSLEQVSMQGTMTNSGEVAFTFTNGQFSDNISKSLPEITNYIKSESSLISTASFQGINFKNQRPRASYLVEIKPQAFHDILEKLPKDTLTAGHIEITSDMTQELLKLWRDNINQIPTQITVDLLSMQLVDFSISINAPSIAYVSKTSLLENYTANDSEASKVLVDEARQIQNSLNKFYEKNGGYPESKNGLPEKLVPEFLPVWPGKIPTESCSEYYREFNYSHAGNETNKRQKLYSEFSVTFCLPEDFENFKAGIAVITKDDLLTSTNCPDSNIPGCFTKPLEVLTDTTEAHENSVMSAQFELFSP